MKRITLIRHGKSSWEYAALKDIDRPLNERGNYDVPLMGKVLSKNLPMPDLIISSPARRAKDTALGLAKGLNYKEDDIDFRHIIYEGDETDLQHEIQNLPDKVNHVFIIGHNPVLFDFIEQFEKDKIGKFPTAAVASLTSAIKTWQDFGKEKVVVDYFDKPKNYKEKKSS